MSSDPNDPSGDPTLTPSQARGMAAEPTSAASGSPLGRYELLEEIGAGGMGVVHRGHDPALGRALAIKLVRPRRGGADARARLLREAQAMARLHHANVVPVFDVGTRGDQVFLVMPYLPGTLGGWLRARPRPWREVVTRFLAAARGLEAAHDAGLIHRDFKPDNVLVGERGEVQVADFGLAQVDDDDDDGEDHGTSPSPSGAVDLTRTGEVLGTPAYMAPEQLRGEALDARADQFAFCVALHEGLYGRRPFEIDRNRGADAIQALYEQIAGGHTRPPPDDTEVPRWLHGIVLRGLRPEAANRWPTIAELVAAVERGLDGDEPDAHGVTTLDLPVKAAVATAPAPSPAPAPPPRRRRRVVAIAAATAVLCIPPILWLARSTGGGKPPVVDLPNQTDAALERRCDDGNAPACLVLADRVSRRLDGPPDFPRAYTLVMRACDLGDASGCAGLAGMYADGNGVTVDLPRARQLAAQSCTAGSASGCKMHGEMLGNGIGGSVDAAGAITAWRSACDGSVADACRLAANRLRHGRGVPIDIAAADQLESRAFALADAGCDAGNAVDCRTRGMMFNEGKGVTRDPTRALADLDRACRDGSAPACGDAGQFFALGLGVHKDGERARTLLRRGCDGGSRGACMDLVALLAFDPAGPIDPAEARTVAEAICEQRGSCSMLATLYFQGIGVPHDLMRARQLYERSCEAGDGVGCWFAGRIRTALQEDGDVLLLRRACDLGVAPGCQSLGDLAYQRGDDAAAFEGYQQSCSISGGMTCDKLGTLYFEGRGVAADPVRGRALYEQSCGQQSADACHGLGERLRDGDGVAPDPRLAIELFEKACTLGWAWACADGARLLSDDKVMPADPVRAGELRTRACTLDKSMCAP